MSLVNTRLGEVLTTTNKIVIAGEGRGQALFKKYGNHAVINREQIAEIARGVVKDIGYDQDGFSFAGADIEVLLHGQSPDIAMGVDAKKKKGGEQEGAGDQGMMFGASPAPRAKSMRRTRSCRRRSISRMILKVLSDQRHSKKRSICSPTPRVRSPSNTRTRAGRLHQGRRLDPAQRHQPQRQEIHPRW